MKARLKKDSVWVGIAIRLVFPIAMYGFLRLLYAFLDTMGVFSDIGFAEDFRTRTLALIAICSNLLLMQLYRRTHYHHETTRGMLIASMLFVGMRFWKFGFKLLQF